MNGTRITPVSSFCGIVLANGKDCSGYVAPESPINLCADHFQEAFDWQKMNSHESREPLSAPCPLCGSLKHFAGRVGSHCVFCGWHSADFEGMDWLSVAEVGDTASFPAETRVHVVYYIQFGDRIKIGTSISPRGRLQSLPHDSLLAFERGDHRQEHKRHVQFAEYRIGRSEWFTLNEPLLAHIRKLSAGVDDPWAQYEFWLKREARA